MDSLNTYTELTARLKDQFRVISLDLPNFGGSQVTDKITTVPEYAHFLKALADKLRLEDYVLVGHSMGSQIDMYAVGSGIVQPKKLILLSAAGVRNHGRFHKRALKYASVVLRHVVPKKYKKKFYKMIGSDYNPDLTEVHKAIISKVLNADIQAEAKKITVPTLIINGSHDRETPLWMARTLNQEIKGSTLDVIEGGDHWIHQKQADVLAESIKVFAS
jgi:pimeloyl-ACP methyl ester carboxylesterase